MQNYYQVTKDWKQLGKKLEAIEDFIECLNEILATADVDQPAGQGCGYSINFDEEAVAHMLGIFYDTYKATETN